MNLVSYKISSLSIFNGSPSLLYNSIVNLLIFPKELSSHSFKAKYGFPNQLKQKNLSG